ncbi:hypothetical protein BGX34_001773 [Mortierella sp. NVP85]|nr:hypothetical protein BGX34_001773 [Mortierella sp. NVP85]
MKFIAAVAALALAAVAQAQTFTSCATGATDMTVSSITLDKNPLCVGENVCATVTGTLANPIVETTPGSTKLAIVGRYLGRVVYTDNHDLCTLLAASGHPCPVATSVTSVTACVLVKTSAPVGVPVALTIQATNGNGNTIFCQTATVTAANCPV